MLKALIAGFLGLSLLTGCMVSNYPNLVGKRGNYANQGNTLADVRDARRGITIYSKLPASASNIKQLSVQRCHQNFTEDAPSLSVMEDDLVLAAYANGADGITNIKHTKASGLLKNCWHIKTATGTSFRLN